MNAPYDKGWLRIQLDNGQELAFTAEHLAGFRIDGPPRRINIPQAKRAADLRSVLGDLECAIPALNRLIAIMESAEAGKDALLEHCYWVAVVVHYARCFTQGNRQTGLDDKLIHRELPELAWLHHWLMDLRHKHVAHDENPYQVYLPSVVVKRAPTGHVFLEPNVSMRVLIGVNAERGRAVKELILKVGDIVIRKMEAARQSFRDALKQIPLEEIEALPAVDLSEPTIADAGRRRES